MHHRITKVLLALFVVLLFTAGCSSNPTSPLTGPQLSILSTNLTANGRMSGTASSLNPNATYTTPAGTAASQYVVRYYYRTVGSDAWNQLDQAVYGTPGQSSFNWSITGLPWNTTQVEAVLMNRTTDAELPDGFAGWPRDNWNPTEMYTYVDTGVAPLPSP